MAFAAAAKDRMVTHGFDTVLYMVGKDDITVSPGEALLSYNSKYTREQVKRHVEDMKAHNNYDDYVRKALDESAKWLKNSLDESIKPSLQYTLNIEMSGPELWMANVSEMMAESLQRVDYLRKEFEA